MIGAVLGFVVRHETLVGWLGVLLGASLLGALAAHRLDAPRIAAARAQADAALAKAQASAASARMATAAGAIVETARTREAHLTYTAEETVDAVVHARGADAPVPEDVVRGWAAGLDRLRDEARAARAPAADPGGPGAPRPLPTP